MLEATGTLARKGNMSKVAVWSNAPHCPTGYGQQTAQLTKRLVSDGHEVAVISNYGVAGAPMQTTWAAQLPPCAAGQCAAPAGFRPLV